MRTARHIIFKDYNRIVINYYDTETSSVRLYELRNTGQLKTLLNSEQAQTWVKRTLRPWLDL